MPSEPRPLTYEELAEFIQERMTMSHIYQPLVIRTLIDAGGSATLRQLAVTLAANDEAVLLEAEKRIRDMPVRVLRNREVIDFDKRTGLVTLNSRRLTFEQRARLRALCEQRLGAYLERRGLAVWDYRLIDDSAIPYDLRYRVLADSDGRCALCGATAKERPLDVDHILPRSRGGTNEEGNLQVLCSRCNRAKGNRDARDFRQARAERDPECLFCQDAVAERAVEETGLMVAIRDAAPVTDGHVLVLPKRHTPDFFSLTQVERTEADSILRVVSRRMQEDDPTVVGFNVGSNSGEAAGQTVLHAHIHLIPRRVGDLEEPAGGVRGVIPDKQDPRRMSHSERQGQSA